MHHTSESRGARLSRRTFLGGLTAAGMLTAAGCGGGGGDGGTGGGPAPAGRETVPVEVPPALATPPFDVPRSLTVPAGFGVTVFARLPRVRFVAAAPNGDLLAAETFADRVRLLRPVAGGLPEVHTFADGMRAPHDIVFHDIGGTTFVYIAESTGVNRFVYAPGATSGQSRQAVVTGLPDASTPELQGAHGHMLKNIALDRGHRLYVSSASATNASPSDVLADPPRAAILQYDADGGGGRRVFARGLRNAEGLAFLPGTDELWVTVNQRDNIRYPHDDGTGRYGQVVPEYVDNHPPEGFTRVRDGGNYGWPYANPTPDGPTGMDEMPFDPDVENNAGGAVADVSSFDRLTKGMQAHSAPLGLLFLQDTAFDARYRNGAVIALHGSWNRTRRVGYKFVYFPWDADRERPGAEQDFVAGWLDDGAQTVWGRPVDMAVAPNGDMYLSDDHSGTIYRLYRKSA